MQDSKIEWTHHTFNPWRGCTKVSAGCANCYADALSKRNPLTLGVWGPNGTRVVAAESAWRQPVKWDRAAKAAGERHRVFCASLADVSEDWTGPMTDAKGHHLFQCCQCQHRWSVPDAEHGPLADTPRGRGCCPACLSPGPNQMAMNDVRRRLFALIDATPNLDWLLLTKRPENVLRMTYDSWCRPVPGHVSQDAGDGRHWHFPPNVWLGTSAEDQATADARIPHLLKVPAAVRFLSMEPLLGPVDLRFAGRDAGACDQFRTTQDGDPFLTDPRIGWVIVGGESGPGARPMNPDWARSLRDQCVAAGVPFHFKQHGDWADPDQIDADIVNDLILAKDDGLGGYPRRDFCVNAFVRIGVIRVGKAAAGRLLDGRTWDELPAT